ncbi:MFS transporter [Brevibacillus fulvus]|uniref:YNFM family putative membrane transporter n=1 Tax=Brevibacillus fulvus TaxID=1125967 RepID=A0A938XWX2_9BACL|nr:MFS transporter [Brevibacillus fulvus]MBM7591998.1 YNFM family putative membrane transporter [Brevibacillus fulvus]
MNYIRRGSKAYRKVNLALFAGGFTTFAVLYCTQPMLPEFTREFQVSPTVASLSLSVTTIALSISMLLFGTLSEAWGRKPIMATSLFAASVLAIFTALSPTYHVLLAVRILEGIVLAGLPAIAMAYLGEEIEPSSLGAAMGLYISGNSLGGLGGRVVTGMLTDWFNWRVAIAGIGVISLLASLYFFVSLPPSRHFQPRKLEVGKLLQSLWSHCRNGRLLALFSIGFLLMGSFVTLYNYIGFQLIAPPYELSQTLVGWIFILYLVGTFSSSWMGRLADRYGRHHILWAGIIIFAVGACITLHGNLWLKIVGIAIFTFGFFGSHSIASSWVGLLASHDKAQASSLYLFFYYMGSSIGGTAGGLFWSMFGWAGVVGMILFLLCLAFLLSLRLAVKGKSVQGHSPIG